MNVFFQDNILAAEKPPDAPSHEETGDPFLKKDDFLFDSFDQWKGPQDAAVSENDVFLFDESTTAPAASGFPEKTVDLEPAATGSECMLGLDPNGPECVSSVFAAIRNFGVLSKRKGQT